MINKDEIPAPTQGERERSDGYHQEAIDEVAEEKYWRKHFKELGYVAEADTYEVFEVAFRTGYVGRGTYRGRKFEQVEPELKANYEAAAGENALPWEKAVCAVCDAWNQASVVE